MTRKEREEAIIYFEQCNSNIISVCKDENKYDYEKQDIISDCARKTYEANKLAIEALEQEPILDKIRAEIVESAKRTMNDTRAEGLYMALQIIDKYRKEHET